MPPDKPKNSPDKKKTQKLSFPIVSFCLFLYRWSPKSKQLGTPPPHLRRGCSRVREAAAHAKV
jgi:hypothetical protein